MVKEWTVIEKSSDANIQMGLNRIIKIGHGRLCLREKYHIASFNNIYIIFTNEGSPRDRIVVGLTSCIQSVTISTKVVS